MLLSGSNSNHPFRKALSLRCHVASQLIKSSDIHWYICHLNQFHKHLGGSRLTFGKEIIDVHLGELVPQVNGVARVNLIYSTIAYIMLVMTSTLYAIYL